MAGEVFSGTSFEPESKPSCRTEQFGESRTSCSNPLLDIEQTLTSGSDEELSRGVEPSHCTTSAPLCRQFWKAGNYDSLPCSKSTLPKGTSHVSVHPKFLHSNATSHKWAFGAIAELLDNAIDEIHNGATFAVVDKYLNPRDGSPALLIQDDGKGMDPEAMLRCLSFGFSDKNSKVSIGQYGNGFKTSTMRLGSDVIVFSRHTTNRKKTQSIGLLSYTFLMETGHDRIVVPMVDYEFDAQTKTWTSLKNAQHYSSNLSLLLQWSPYSSEENLLEQFDDIGSHGTKIVIYNLWHSNDNQRELDFESDPQDIRVSLEVEMRKGMEVTEQHLANRLRTSLRAYLSILYLRIPENFCILLRGQAIMYHNIASDLQYPECILYRPNNGVGFQKAEVITTIGFLKEAPHVKVHGFNVYHKNRLILPFWPVITYTTQTRGRGVVGVLEANFIQPTHNKQDFEKTPAFQKLEQRLNEMTFEYWNLYSGLIGYYRGSRQPDMTSGDVSATSSTESLRDRELSETSNSLSGESKNGPVKRKVHGCSLEPDPMKKKAGSVKREVHCSLSEPEPVKKKAVLEVNATKSNKEVLPANDAANESNDEHRSNLIEENKKLHAKFLKHERNVKELDLKVVQLRTELEEAQKVYDRLLAELKLEPTF